MSPRARRPPVLTLTTDFGGKDAYVASMKGVVLRAVPEARIVDISHEIPPQEIGEAGYVLACAFPHFPAGTLHLLVVDPGVGTSRRLLAARTRQHLFLAPDNGSLGLAFDIESPLEIVEIPFPDSRVAPTFHGRDILAPAAARLLQGAALSEIGPPVSNPLPFPVPQARPDPDGRLRVSVLSIDRFGNVILNFRAQDAGVTPGPVLEIAGRRLTRRVLTYAEAPAAEPVLLFNSSGFLEVAVTNGSAAQTLGCARGTTGILTL
ncbi:MAG TPA: SAM-dependent chlorinase/fluorinase [Candidatus Polarisedimenticolia bacterium]|nr:SAM-dependent chlorinase/fluorinase [Candidatus Polarisedimenticolia bacterium]